MWGVGFCVQLQCHQQRFEEVKPLQPREERWFYLGTELNRTIVQLVIFHHCHLSLASHRYRFINLAYDRCISKNKNAHYVAPDTNFTQYNEALLIFNSFRSLPEDDPKFIPSDHVQWCSVIPCTTGLNVAQEFNVSWERFAYPSAQQTPKEGNLKLSRFMSLSLIHSLQRNRSVCIHRPKDLLQGVSGWVSASFATFCLLKHQLFFLHSLLRWGFQPHCGQ